MQRVQKRREFFLNTAKSAVVCFAIFLFTIFILSSCKKKSVPGPDFMNFLLTQDGSEVSISSPLSYGGTYRLTIKSGRDAEPQTANYIISYTPSTVFSGVTIHTNSIDFTVANTPEKTVTITITHKDDSSISQVLVLHLKPSTEGEIFQQDIENAPTVPDFTKVGKLAREVLEPLGAASGATLNKIYVTESGAGSRDGSSWANAWAATDLRNGINTISDASTSKVYLVMIAGGTYKPTYGANRNDSFHMKNRMAIMGGFQAGGGWERTGTTTFSGDINTVGNAADNSYHVFDNSGTIDNSHLYDVVITGGNADNPTSGDHLGGGMYNNGFSSSPTITKVLFINNYAKYGGGMANFQALPAINDTAFTGNRAGTLTGEGGGGMFNDSLASPILNNVMFKDNKAGSGGGVYDRNSFSVLKNVVFTGNKATLYGGGMYNSFSAPIIIGAVFRGNSALYGGGMDNDSQGQQGPLIANAIFLDNTINSATGVGPDISINRNGSTGEGLRIVGSVLGIGLQNATNGIVGYGGSATMTINYHHLKNTAVNFGPDVIVGRITYPSIQSGSSAIDLGVFARNNGTSYYLSDNNTTWYTYPITSGGWGNPVSLPSNTEDATATDITGKTRTGRPDAGVFEF